MKNFITILFVTLSLIGCAYYEDRAKYANKHQESMKSISYDIHGDCPLVYRQTIEQKGREWGSVSRHNVTYNVIWDLSPATIMQYSDAPQLICRASLRDENGRPLCGSTTGTLIQLSMSEFCNMESNAVHEFGHLMGLADLPNSEAVMNQSKINKRISAADVRACAELHFCPNPGHKDTTEVTVTIDPSIPNINPTPPGW